MNFQYLTQTVMCCLTACACTSNKCVVHTEGITSALHTIVDYGRTTSNTVDK